MTTETQSPSANSADIAIDALQVRRALERFRLLNTQRFNRVQESLEQSQRIFLDLLPLLFHINHPVLPGFQSGNTPFGISNYSPDKYTIKKAKSLATTFRLTHQAMATQNIHAIYIMGSTGTIAYSKNSDFDIWICTDPLLDQDARYALQQKANAIESWGESLGLEIHFFILDDTSFRNQQHAELSTHSSGNSQHALLLDEFYRTSILITGRYPVWWLVPPELEPNYNEYKQKLLSNRFAKREQLVDFGGLESLPVEEFYGASLWQLNKAIESPYKSILKLNLLESYTAGSPHNQLLAIKFKQAIYDERHLLDSLDPYVMTCHAIEDYLFATRQTRRLELVRRCFYFKIDEPLSNPQNKSTWRREQLQRIVDSWGWGEDKIRDLDRRHLWKTSQVINEYRLLMRELESSYLRIKNNAEKENYHVTRDQRDIVLLTKKLSTIFNTQEQTIELFNPGISKNLHEQELTFIFSANKDSTIWKLYSGKHNQDNVTDKLLLRESNNLIDLLAWCHFNKIVSHNTVGIHLHPNNNNNRHWEIQSLINSMQDFFPHSSKRTVEITALAQPAFLQRTCIYINTNIDPMQQLAANGMHLLTNQNDPLNYGQQNTNLVKKCELVGLNSWNQIIINKFTQANALLDCICDYLSWFIEGKHNSEHPVCCNFSSTNSNAVTRRITELLSDIIECFYENNTLHDTRYLLKAGGYYYLFEIENATPRYQQFNLYGELLNALSQLKSTYTFTHCDGPSLKNNTLAQVLSNNQPDITQLFFIINDNEASVFILDEFGALFHERVAFRDQHTLLNPYLTFLKSIHKNQQPKITVNQISSKKHDLRNAHIPETLQPITTLSVRLNCHPDDLREENIEIIFGDRVFEAGTNDIFQKAAQCVVDSRQSKSNYPVHITDIQYSDSCDQDFSQTNTIQLLKLKRVLEAKLNNALSIATALTI